ncbi:MAG TPA: hypothetical protein VFS97_07490 [Nitrososphaeraceae archaeon]|nr:hypothetical protein [Nitrososphaeraceae archaeon]
MLSSVFLVTFGQQNADAVELFSKDDKPFDVPYDTWVSKFWNWSVGLNSDESTPTPDGCLINKSDSMVMLMGTTVDDSPHQICEISSKQGVMVPMWGAWCDTGDHKGLSDEQLTKCAREEYNLGNIGSQVKVDVVLFLRLT